MEGGREVEALVWSECEFECVGHKVRWREGDGFVQVEAFVCVCVCVCACVRES